MMKEEASMAFTKQHTLQAKGLAILLLLFYHLFESAELLEEMAVDYRPFSGEAFLTMSGFGNICVAVFVFLTSYGIATGLYRQADFSMRNAMEQATKRFGKLMLGFAAMYLSVVLIWWKHFDFATLYGEGKQGLLYMLTDGLGLSMFFDTPTLNMTWWYMEIAYLLIFLVPFLYLAVKEFGKASLLLGFFLPYVFPMGTDLKRYFFVAVVGVCAACFEWPGRLLNSKIPKAFLWAGGIALFALSILIRQNYAVHETYIHLADAPIALVVVFVASALLGSVPVLNSVLAFLGKHSMNIFLVHTFFYMTLWRNFVYQFHKWWATFFVCLGLSLLYSIVLELLKKGVMVGCQKLAERKNKA